MALYDLPRGPIQFESSDSPDNESGYDRNIAAWRSAAFEEAIQTRRLSDEMNRTKTYIDYVEGNHSHGVFRGQGRKADYRAKFYINKVGKARTDQLAMLTDAKPTIEISAKTEEYIGQSKVLDEVIRAEWVANAMDLSLDAAVDIAGIMGTAFWKIAAASPGIMRLTPAGPDVVMPIQPGFHVQQSTAVLYRTWKSLIEVMKKFPMYAHKLEREAHSSYYSKGNAYQRPDNYDQWTWSGLAPQMQRALSRQRINVEQVPEIGYFKTIEWQEYYIEDPTTNDSNKPVLMKAPGMSLEEHNWWYWVPPKGRLYPRKRLLIFAGNCLVYDGPSPYWHGLYPFACLKLNPVFWSFWGLSKYRDLLPVNSAINEIVCGVLDMVDKALKPTVVSKNTIPTATWRKFFPDMPGAKLQMNNMGNPQQDIRYMDPPMIPQYVLQMLAEYLGPEFDKLSGSVDIAGLAKKMQVPGGDTIEQMRDSLQTSTRRESRFTEVFLQDAGIQTISNIIQFYTARRRMSLIGPDGVSLSDFMYDPGSLLPNSLDSQQRFEFWRQFPMTVVPGSMHGGARDRTKVMAMGLRRQGDISRKRLLTMLDFAEIKQNEQELEEEQAKMAELGMMTQGGGDAPRMTRSQRNGSPV